MSPVAASLWARWVLAVNDLSMDMRRVLSPPSDLSQQPTTTAGKAQRSITGVCAGK
jgi:hypothetical protein